MRPHPILSFEAPESIHPGMSLADLFGPKAIELIGESFATSVLDFDVGLFVKDASSVTRGLPFKRRTTAIARVLRRALPEDDHVALAALRGSWGPELQETHGNGLRGLFYMPHSALLGEFASTLDDGLFAAALEANFQLTTRFTAEFSIRSFLGNRFDQTMEALQARIDDPNPHVRRLVSEGTRPRLPWAAHLKNVRADPHLTLPLLVALRDDRDRYVTRSVANHLGDIGKDHPDVLLNTCREWLDELDDTDRKIPFARERRWLIRHALRHPAKKGENGALAMRRRAAK
jgi:3-methyladenine DNA glycosylase AlkC